MLSGLPEINTNKIINELNNTYILEASKVIMFNTNSQSKLKDLNMKLLNTIRVIHSLQRKKRLKTNTNKNPLTSNTQPREIMQTTIFDMCSHRNQHLSNTLMQKPSQRHKSDRLTQEHHTKRQTLLYRLTHSHNQINLVCGHSTKYHNYSLTASTN